MALHGIRSKSLKWADRSRKNTYTKMANEQSNVNELIVQAMAEAARVTIQAMAAAGAERTQNVGLRLVRPIMKQPSFNWGEDKYNELINVRLEVNYIF